MKNKYKSTTLNTEPVKRKKSMFKDKKITILTEYLENNRSYS